MNQPPDNGTRAHGSDTHPGLVLGGVFSTHDTLGPSPQSSWTGPPTPGNDFFTRYVEDLELLAQSGIRAIRLGLDWARLQSAPGRVDDDWREWYHGVLLVSQRLGIDVWLALHESTVPAWFDDEGSFGDRRTATLAWPRWVETAAELFGDLAAGWFPLVDPVTAAARWSDDPRRHEEALINLAVAWRDAWRILRGGPPVATALGLFNTRPVGHGVPAEKRARFEEYLRWRLWLRALRDGVLRLPNGSERQIADLDGSLDHLGIVTTLDHPELTISDESLRRWEERLGTVLRRAGEEGPDRPIDLCALRVDWQHESERQLLVETGVNAIESALRDGVQVRSVFVDPTVRMRATSAALTDRDRQPTGELPAWRRLITTPGLSTGSGRDQTG